MKPIIDIKISKVGSRYRHSSYFQFPAEETANLEFSSKPVNGRCLNLMQEAQENFHFKRDLVAKNCAEYMEPLHAKYDEIESLKARSQLEWGRCKPNVTDECINAYHDFLSFSSDLVDDKKLKNCYGPIVFLPTHLNENGYGYGYGRVNDFLPLTKDEDDFGTSLKEKVEIIFDILKESCKFKQFNV